MDSKSQRNGVQDELKRLREQHLAKNQREKLKELSMAPLTTPEEAQAFLATMREAQHKREKCHQPPSNLSADGMDAWFLKQRKEEQELRSRRREAEELLRNYRGTSSNNNNGSSSSSMSLSSSNHRTSADSQRNHRLSYAGSDHGLDTPIDPNENLESFSDVGVGPSLSSSSQQAKQMLPTEDQEEKKDSFEPSPHLRQQQSQSSIRTPYQGRTPRNASTEFTLDNVGIGSPAPTVSQRPPDEVVVEEETIWRDFVSSEPGARFPPQAGRYHLYCSYACPGSHRALIVRALKGLDDPSIIGVTYVHPVWRLTRPHDPNDKHRGWVFGRPGGDPFANTIHKGGPFPAAYADNEPDPHNPDAFSIRDLYEAAHDTSGKYTIPILWDTHLKTIVNNESSDIAYMFNSCFNNLSKHPHVDLYTEDDALERAKLSQVSDWLSPLMIHGVYRCGFAKSQWAYDRAINDLCAAFDRADDILERQRFLTANDALTDVDIRLFVTLLRFDEVYTVYFKANARLVLLTPSLLNFCRDIYQLPGVAATCNMEQIKAHFFASHAEWNKYSVIPRGLGFMELLDMPHDRDNFFYSAAETAVLSSSTSPQPQQQQIMLPSPSPSSHTAGLTINTTAAPTTLTRRTPTPTANDARRTPTPTANDPINFNNNNQYMETYNSTNNATNRPIRRSSSFRTSLTTTPTPRNGETTTTTSGTTTPTSVTTSGSGSQHQNLQHSRHHHHRKQQSSMGDIKPLQSYGAAYTSSLSPY